MTCATDNALLTSVISRCYGADPNGCLGQALTAGIPNNMVTEDSMAKAKSKHYDEGTAQTVTQALQAMQSDPGIQPERGQKRTTLKAVIQATAQDIRAAYEAGYTLEQIVAALRAKAQVEISSKTLRQYLAEAGCNLRGKDDNTTTHTAIETTDKASSQDKQGATSSQGKAKLNALISNNNTDKYADDTRD